jgi:lycopene cyclase domain-containing protein
VGRSGGEVKAVTYALINLWFLVALGLIAAIAWRGGVKPRVAGMVGSFIVVGVLTAIFDNAIIGFGLVDYDPEKISGIRLGVAPIEDFAYTLAGAVLVPLVWTALGHRGSR